MIDKSTLFQAKAFLCWDKFPDLSIKLIPIEKSAAFFHPPAGDVATINLFYEKDNIDFTRDICLLFHEAGHLKQWKNFCSEHRELNFWQLLDLDKGDEKAKFEREAWDFGAIFLNEFAQENNLVFSQLIPQYKALAEESIKTYK
ncbi:MAG TPA: hypothetical protein VGD14_11890 [bacterium]